MEIESVVTGAFQEICYIVWDESKQALVFDPGDDAELILQTLDKHGLQIAAYICTHGHTDHISALTAMHSQRPAPIAIHSQDLAWAFDPSNRLAPHYSVPRRPAIESFELLESATD